MPKIIFGKSGSSKSTLLVKMLRDGLSCFDSDFIYTIFYREFESMKEGPPKWDKAHKLFKLVIKPANVDIYGYYFTADTRTATYLEAITKSRAITLADWKGEIPIFKQGILPELSKVRPEVIANDTR